MYYHCQICGKKYKYATDLIPVFGSQFGNCPDCDQPGVFEKDGPRAKDDLDYEEIE